MKIWVSITVFLFLAASCTSIKSVSTSTVASLITPTPTEKPLSDLVLDDLLILPGDLPAGFGAGQIRYEIEGTYAGIARSAELTISQQISYGNKLVGRVVVLLYDDILSVPSLYQFVTDGYTDGEFRAVSGLGDGATVVATLIFPGTSYEVRQTEMAFYHCHVLVEFAFSGLADEATAIAYATRLDQRLEPLVCR